LLARGVPRVIRVRGWRLTCATAPNDSGARLPQVQPVATRCTAISIRLIAQHLWAEDRPAHRLVFAQGLR
jgi:hypothetical protein